MLVQYGAHGYHTRLLPLCPTRKRGCIRRDGRHPPCNPELLLMGGRLKTSSGCSIEMKGIHDLLLSCLDGLERRNLRSNTWAPALSGLAIDDRPRFQPYLTCEGRR